MVWWGLDSMNGGMGVKLVGWLIGGVGLVCREAQESESTLPGYG